MADEPPARSGSDISAEVGGPVSTEGAASAVGTTTGSADDDLAALSATVTQLRDETAAIRQDVSTLQREAYKERIIAELQVRLRELDRTDALLRQGRRSAMLLLDLVRDITSTYAAVDAARTEFTQWRLDLDVLRADVDSLLFSIGLRSFQTLSASSGDTMLDSIRQRAVRKVPAANPEEHLTVAHVVRPGFEDDSGRVVRKEEVVVRFFAPF